MKNLVVSAAFAAALLCSTAYAQDVSVSVSGEVSVSVDPSSTLSSVSSELSSAVSSASSELSSESSSMSSGEEMSCDDLDTATMNVAMLAGADLAAVTSVTIFAVDDCTGLNDLAAIDGGAIATLTTNAMVQQALTAQGEFGGEIVAYTLSDTSLTVYVRDRG
jgi:hypothetical protein